MNEVITIELPVWAALALLVAWGVIFAIQGWVHKLRDNLWKEADKRITGLGD